MSIGDPRDYVPPLNQPMWTTDTHPLHPCPDLRTYAAVHIAAGIADQDWASPEVASRAAVRMADALLDRLAQQEKTDA